VTKTPAIARPYYNYAKALHRAGRLDEAITFYEKVIAMEEVPFKVGPGAKFVALHNLGAAYEQIGMYQQALRCYQTNVLRHQSVVESVPYALANTYYNAGAALVKLGEYRKAIEAYEQALKEYHQGKEIYEPTLDVSPDIANTYVNLGWVWMKLERYDEAEIALKKALQFNPLESGAYLNLGTLYSKDPSRRSEAVHSYRRYLALKPTAVLRERILERITSLEKGLDPKW
jgi:tetratricopeptide (TPR) repeat protein